MNLNSLLRTEWLLQLNFISLIQKQNPIICHNGFKCHPKTLTENQFFSSGMGTLHLKGQWPIHLISFPNTSLLQNTL